MLTSNITKCPLCGDTEEGYRYIVTQSYVQRRGWDPRNWEDASCDEDLGVGHHGAYRCNACNKIIKPRE